MEKFALTLQSTNSINEYINDRFLMGYEREMMAEILALIEKGDQEQLAWFAGFGDSFCKITKNVNQYRKGLTYGFTEIAYDHCGWFASPKFLDREDIQLEQSSIRLGRGLNHIWSYALSLTYGTAGSSGPLGVFCPPFKSREAALDAALSKVKLDFSSKIDHPDTTNYKPDLIRKTLQAISALEVSRVQLSLF